MTDAERLDRDIQEILGTGVNRTATVMEMLKERGWSTEVIMPVAYQLLLRGKVDPNGNPTPYRTN
jgi:hypothetical protein